MIQPEKLKELISYDPLTGDLTWKPRASSRFNTQSAGTPALANPSKGYRTGRLLGKNVKAHRAAWAIHYGEWPIGMIDHINGDRSDNRISNLRVVDASENGKNQRPRRTNKTGQMCINWFPRDKKWWVKITANGRQKHVGYFDTFEDAVAARDLAYAENGFHENHGR